MAERERLELELDIVGIQQFAANANTLRQQLRGIQDEIRNTSASQGGTGRSLQLTEQAQAIQLSLADMKRQQVQADAERFKASKAGQAAIAAAEYQPRITQAGQPYKQDLKTQLALQARASVVNENTGTSPAQDLAALNIRTLQATKDFSASQARLTATREKREKFEEENTEAAQQAAAAAKLDVQRRRGQQQQLNQADKEQADAARQTAAASRSLAAQRKTAEAKLAAQEAFQRENYIAPEKLQAMQQPLAGVGESVEQRTSVALAKTESELQSVYARMAEIRRLQTAGGLTEYQAGQQMRSAQRTLTGVLERRTVLESKLSAETGTFGEKFARGFRGGTDRPYAEQLGQAIKFSAFYGAAYKLQFALLSTFRQALQQGIEFEQGLSDMAVATGQPKTELRNLAETLAQISSNAGAAPSAGVQVGARAIGLYGLAGSTDLDQQKYVAQLSAQVVSKLAFGTKVDVVSTQEDLAAITQALGMGAGGQLRVADLDAYFTKRFGAAAGSTLEAASTSASVGVAAGFSIEQIQALAALMVTNTGQSSTAIGGYLAQMFSRGGEGTLTGVAQKYGIQTQGRQLADVFSDLSKMYRTSGTQAQTEIAAAFGRGKVQNAVVAALRGYGEVQQAARDAQGGAADGALNRQFSQRINNIGGQIAILGGHLKEFAHLFGESGLLSTLGIAVVAFDKLVTSVNAILLAFDELPGPLRDLIGLLVAYAAAQRIGLIGAGLGKLKEIYNGGAAAAAGVGSFEAAELGSAAAAGSGGLRAVGAAAFKTLGPFAIATAGLLAVGYLADSARKLKVASDNTVQTIRQSPDYNASPTELRNYASQLKNQATEDAKVGTPLKKFIFGTDLDADAARLRDEATRITALAKRAEENYKPTQPATFASFDAQSFSTALDDISRSGGTATQRVKALTDAIDGLDAPAAKIVDVIDPSRLAGPLAAAAAHVAGVQDVPVGPVHNVGGASKAGTGARPLYFTPGKDVSAEVARQLPGDVIETMLTDQLKALGVTNFRDLTEEQRATITKNIASTLKASGAITAGTLGKVQGEVGDALLNALDKQTHDVLDQIVGASDLTATEATAFMTALIAEIDAKTNLRPQTDFAGRIREAQSGLKQAFQIRADTRPEDKNSPAVLAGIQTQREKLASAQIDQAEAERKVAESTAKTQEEAARRARPLILRELHAAINAGSQDQLARVLGLAGPEYKTIADQFINQAANLAGEGEAAARKAARQAKRMQDALDKLIADYKGALAAVPDPFAGQPVIPGTVLVPKTDTGGTKPNTAGLHSAIATTVSATNSTTTETAAEIRAAALAAEAARRGGAIAPAQAALAQARAELQKAAHGTVAYYNALASVYQAQDQLSQAFRDYRHILGELRIDTTNPLAEANLALQTAREKLRSDIARGKAGDVVAQDKLDVKNAQNSAESTVFSQRLQDVQTADDLGRISHSAYLRYLQSEHNRLSAIAKRTHQQTDELNQIDKLMKDAASSMQGAFNIGDIKLPTPYEVRRYIKTQVGSTALAQQGATGGTTTIYINGADTGAVKRIIDDTVGKGTRVLTTTTRRT